MSFANISQVALFQETTAGTPPADWDASGLPLFTQGVPDLSSVQQTQVADGRSVLRAGEVHQNIPGVRSTATFPVSTAGQGTGQGVIADTSTVVANAQSLLIKNALGGQVLVPSTILAGTHSTTSLDLALSTGYEIGGFVCIQDADATGDVVVYSRRIVSKAVDVVGLDEELPFTPVDGDPCHSHIQSYIDEAVLCDPTLAPSTLSWAITLGGSTNPVAWQVTGSQANLTGFTISSDEVVAMEFTVMAGSFTEPNNFTPPTYATATDGTGGFVAGLGTKLFIQDYGTTTSVCVNAAEISVTPGVTSTRVPTVTECDAGLEGIAGYVLSVENTMFSTTTIPYDTGLHDDLENQQAKVIRYSNDLPPGAGFALSFPKAYVFATPTPGEAENRLAISTEFRAHEDDAITGAASVEQQLSKLSIVQW